MTFGHELRSWPYVFPAKMPQSDDDKVEHRQHEDAEADHVARIRSLANELNYAIDAAHAQGLDVMVQINHLATRDRRKPRPSLQMFIVRAPSP